MNEKREILLITLAKYALRFAVVCACIYVIYEQFSDFQNTEARQRLIVSSWEQKGWLLAVVALLMPVNWLLETKKWQLLMSVSMRSPFSKLLKAVMQGVMVGTVTPWRMGEFVGRAFDMPSKEAFSSFFYSALGGMGQAFVTALFGLFFLPWFYPSQALIWFSIVICGALLLSYFYFDRLLFAIDLLRLFPFATKNHLSHPSISILGIALVMSGSRYVVYLLQWMLVAYVFSVHENFLFLAAGTSVTLLLQSVSPALPFFDLAVRSGISLLVFSNICSNPMSILLSTIAVWLINIALPSLLGIIFFMQNWRKKTSVAAAQANIEQLYSK
jgi:hypothetical protein